ncbi:hypothetical protein V5799_033498 [Amblyomma americanum]|uniref:Monocarboxylate transporter n=1 Tax=Amblyomma americanum TaxID=6943 RepID=A0AAQ4DN53_AMBAM
MAEEPPKPGEEPGAAPAPEGEQPPVPAEGEQPPVPPEGEQPAVPPEGEQPPPGEQPAQPAPEAPAPDGQHSWMVAVAVAWNVFCSSLLRRALPVMFYAVGDAFSVEAKGSVAWMNAFIYSLAYTLTPVVAVMCRTTPLRTLSVAGSTLVGVGQIACFVLGSVYLMVPVVALFCGLAAAVSMAVAETALHLHFVSERHKAMSLYHGAFSLSAIVYPAVMVGLVETYGLNGALLVSGAISLNALAGSMLINRLVSPLDKSRIV